MNYFLILVILGLCAAAYYQHTQDEQQIATLQQQLAEMSAKPKAVSNPAESPGENSPFPARAPAAAHPVTVAVLPASHSRSSAIDSAVTAATTAQNSDSMGTITTLDGRTFQDCKVLKIEADGITFSHADGITKILFPLLRPELQKKYGYDPQKAVAETAAQINYQQSVQQTAPAPAASNP